MVKFLAETSNLVAGLGQVAQQARNANRASQAAAGGAAQMNRESQRLTRTINTQNQSIGNTNNLLKELHSQTGSFTTSFRRAALSIQTGSEWLDKFSIRADRASMTMWRFMMAGVSLKQFAMTTGAVAAGMGLVTKQMVDSFSMVDRIKRQFSAIYQSAEVGGQMVDQLVNDAVKIRYTVEQVLEAGRLLAVEGFNPKDLIYDMADLAAGVNQEGITIVNATRAFVDATNGQFRRLKETFQITREDAMQFAPDAFAGPNGQITNQARAVDALVRAIRAKYRGMNEATMQTVQGQLSNLDDALTQLGAAMGKNVSGTIIGWITSLKDFIGTAKTANTEATGLIKLFDSPLGKAIANTLLWGTALMAAATGLALVAAGGVTLMGVFAALKVYMNTQGEQFGTLLKAEMELMGLNRALAQIEAERSLADISTMRAKLALLQAINKEERARAQVILLEQAGVTGPRMGNAQQAVNAAVAARNTAQVEYNRAALPRQIVQAEQAVLEAQAAQNILQEEINALQGAETVQQREQLGLAAARTSELERQAQVLRQQLSVSMGGGVVTPGVTPNAPSSINNARQIQARLVELKREEWMLEGRLLDVSNIRWGADATRLDLIREQIALREQELAVAESTLATDEADVVAQRAGLMAGRGALGMRIGGSFGGGADAMIKLLSSPFRGIIDAFKGITAGAATFGAKLASLAGAFTVLLPILVAIGGTAYVLDYAKKVHEQFIDSIKSSIKELDAWSGLLKRNPATEQAVKTGAEDIDALIKMDRAKVGPTNVYEQLMKQEGMTFARAREIIAKLAYQAELNTSGDVNRANAQREAYRKASDAQLRGKAGKFGNDVIDMGIQGMGSDLEAMDKTMQERGRKLDFQARKWIDAKLASQDLTNEERKQYQEMLNMTHPAIALANVLKDQYDTAKESVPEFKSASDVLDDAEKNGDDTADAFAEIDANAAAAEKAVADMRASMAELNQLDTIGAKEREKELKRAEETARLLREQANLKQIIVNLGKTQNAQDLMGASGMGNMGAIFGADIAAGEWAAAAGEADPKKKRERLQAALKAARGSREDYAKQSLDLYAPGPNASPAERAKYERYKADVERQRMSGVEADYQRAMAQGNLTPEQKQRAQRQIDAERRTSANAIAGYNSEAYKIESGAQLGQMEARRRGAEIGGASESQLLQMDTQILRLKLQQAIANNDITEQMNIQVQMAERLKQSQEAVLGAEEAKLSYMQSMADQGLIGEDAVEMEKRKLAAMYQQKAQMSAPDSAEYWSNMQKSLDLLGDQTKDKWKGIVGEIIGAPAALVQRVASEGWINQMFGDAANSVGMGDKMRADIVGQTNRSWTLQISWADINAMDQKMQQAVNSGMNGFVRDFSHALTA